MSNFDSFSVTLLNADAIHPIRGSTESAGLDIYSIENCIVPSRGSKLISTGIALNLPKGTYGRLASRSGLAVKHNIEVGAGVVDRDYKGEVKVLLRNHSDNEYCVKKHTRIAQLIIENCFYSRNIVAMNDKRKDRGFGSTGV